ncbi:MAG: hypothetical protein BHW14_01670 [Coprococcus sp. 43_8]|nr:MAG: hypothetical protein BHW14_01670 [Coprococcus sp. 43_8]
MYLKMVGCLGIVAATSGYGYSRGMEYQRQITDTGELQRVIRQLAGEMEYTYGQNYRIWLEHLAKELEMPSRSLAIIWERCCESDLECLLLGREERVRLHELGMQLGSLDKKQETQIFLQYAEFLEEKRGGLLKEIQEKRRLCNLLGVTAGLFLTILIL